MWCSWKLNCLYLRFMIHRPAGREEFHLHYMKRFVPLETYVQSRGLAAFSRNYEEWFIIPFREEQFHLLRNVYLKFYNQLLLSPSPRIPFVSLYKHNLFCIYVPFLSVEQSWISQLVSTCLSCIFLNGFWLFTFYIFSPLSIYDFQLTAFPPFCSHLFPTAMCILNTRLMQELRYWTGNQETVSPSLRQWVTSSQALSVLAESTSHGCCCGERRRRRGGIIIIYWLELYKINMNYTFISVLLHFFKWVGSLIPITEILKLVALHRLFWLDFTISPPFIFIFLNFHLFSIIRLFHHQILDHFSNLYMFISFPFLFLFFSL